MPLRPFVTDLEPLKVRQSMIISVLRLLIQVEVILSICCELDLIKNNNSTFLSFSCPCTNITISYKNRLMYTLIINTTLLTLCRSDVFQPLNR